MHVPQTRPAGCSVDDALAGALFDAQQRIDAFPSAILQASQATTNAIKAKYGSLDGSKMTPGDKEATEAALNAVAPALRTLAFEKDLQKLRDFWAIAQDVHNDRIMDVRENGADASAVGNTEEAEFSGRTSRDQMLFNRLSDWALP
ncbi:hypothetical protein HLH33_20215 [Gluconacetobacter diazotrophicus]|uniref:Uncharacterized protein n=1 Tax=Gluconacetobacter diazotrophicus TaxID=33996 RepID=A0A7W4NIV3_GLUDI|nr:hypothetical protein [Gluconacetobacter diazotrophicus]MBB2158561.1 hypothetical protein [Gluconacetobacter diazotrophicus]